MELQVGIKGIRILAHMQIYFETIKINIMENRNFELLPQFAVLKGISWFLV